MNKKQACLSTGVLATLISFAFAVIVAPIQAAIVPAGVKLAPVQTLIRGNSFEPASLDPQKVEGIPGSNIIKDLFEGLVSQDGDGNIIPGQAERWTVSPDNRVFTFTIRESARWSNGDPVTAHDFVFGFQRAVDPKTASHYAWYLDIATITNAGAIIRGQKPTSALGVKAVDAKTFQVTLEQPVPYFIKMLVHATTFPAHAKTIERRGDSWTQPNNMVSNGAYTLSEWVVNEKIVIKRNPRYWNNQATVINQVVFLPVVSSTAELSRYKAGEIHMTSGNVPIPLQHFTALQKEIPNEVKITPRLCSYYYEFNTKKVPFNDVRVRKALAYAIDRQIITRDILKQGQKPAYTLTPEAVSDFVPPATAYSKITQAERNQEAHKLLEAAGYNKQKPLKVTLLYNTDEANKQVAIAIGQMWKALGVQVTLDNKEWKTFLDAKHSGQFQIARGAWRGDYNEASTFLDLKLSTHGNNYSKFANKQYDDLLARSRQVINASERAELYRQAEAILAEEMPMIPIYQHVTSRLVKPFVGGYSMNNVEDNIYTKDLYIMKN